MGGGLFFCVEWTMLLNPQWPEIQQSVRAGQQAMDRYDVVCRVFHLKVQQLVQDLRGGALGIPIAHMHVVEWQKRGLPHVHMLLWLVAEDKPRAPVDYDDLVCAEIPLPDKEPELHALVMQHMIHVPCNTKIGGDPNTLPKCIVSGKCKARFPKRRQMDTVEDSDGYPLYRRRCVGSYVYPGTGETVSDRWVVPYNRALLWRYRTHLNLEVCSTLHAVKYLHKYIHKGGDRAMTALENPATVLETFDAHPLVPAEDPAQEPVPKEDEIRKYLEGRYISAGEAVWRALEFDTHSVMPARNVTDEGVDQGLWLERKVLKFLCCCLMCG